MNIIFVIILSIVFIFVGKKIEERKWIKSSQTKKKISSMIDSEYYRFYEVNEIDEVKNNEYKEYKERWSKIVKLEKGN